MTRTRLSPRSSVPVCCIRTLGCSYANYFADAKAKAELAAKAKGSKGPLNTGSQGIKKSGKK